MTKLYLVRHCEAYGNLHHLLQGSTDFDITETGAEQLKFLGQRFKDIPLDRIYASPLLRTRKTAQAIAEPKGMGIEVCDGLREINCGIYDGKPFSEIYRMYPDFEEIWANHPQDVDIEGGEPMRVSYERIWQTVLSIVRENQGKTIAAATHGGVTRLLLCRLIFGNIERLKDTGWIDNTAVTLLEFDDELKPTIVYQNDFSHVPEEYLPQASKITSFS